MTWWSLWGVIGLLMAACMLVAVTVVVLQYSKAMRASGQQLHEGVYLVAASYCAFALLLLVDTVLHLRTELFLPLLPMRMMAFTLGLFTVVRLLRA